MSLPGGGSTDFLLPEHLDTPLDYEAIGELGSRLATGTMIILDNQNGSAKPRIVRVSCCVTWIGRRNENCRLMKYSKITDATPVDTP